MTDNDNDNIRDIKGEVIIENPELENAEPYYPREVEYEITDDSKPMGFFNRIISVFVSPDKLFENIRIYPKILAPLFAFIILGIVTAVFSVQLTEIVMREQSAAYIERYGIDLNMATQTLSGNQFNAIASLSAAASVVITPYISSFFGAVLLFVISAVFRMKSKFKQYYSTLIHISIVSLTLGAISTAIMVYNDAYVDVLSLAVINPNLSMLDPMYLILSSISVSQVWSAALVAVALMKITGCSLTKAVF
ncbi:MAG: YIP1 family protein, partial [Clostridiales bacterium]|nr:YIP1 family protein [Clostridiales bacterium]